MNKTSIDWPSLGYSWNPIVGCANGCTYCYARKISNRFKMIPDFSEPQFFPGRIDEPCKVNKPATIFVGSMCDIFSEGIKQTWVHHIIETVNNCPQHTFMFLTKKPVMYVGYAWPKNCILGTTITKKTESSRLSALYGNCSYNKVFASVEPILSDMSGVYFSGCEVVIVGSDSTQGSSKPSSEWVKSITHSNIWYKSSIRKLYPEFKNK